VVSFVFEPRLPEEEEKKEKKKPLSAIYALD